MEVTNYSGDRKERTEKQKIGHGCIAGLKAVWAAICCCLPKVANLAVAHEAGSNAGNEAEKIAADASGIIFTAGTHELESLENNFNGDPASPEAAARLARYEKLNKENHDVIDTAAAALQAAIVVTGQPEIEKVIVEVSRKGLDTASDHVLGALEEVEARSADGTLKAKATDVFVEVSLGATFSSIPDSEVEEKNLLHPVQFHLSLPL